MTANDRFDRDLSAWLGATAPATGPAGLHAGTIDRARAIRQRPAWLVRVRGGTFGPSERFDRWLPRTGYVLAVVALLVVTVIVALLVGAYRSPSPLGRNGAIVFYWQGNDHSGNGTTFVQADGTSRKVRSHGCTTFSDDGRHLIYEQGETDTSLVLDPMDGSPVTEVPLTFVHHGIAFRSYEVSPDSGRVAWLTPGHEVTGPPMADGSTSSVEVGHELWVSPVGGGPGLRVVPAPSTPDELVTFGQPTWSPDGRSIALTMWVYALVDDAFEVRRSALIVARADGSGYEQLTSHRPVGDTISWSPDGRRLAFIGLPDGEEGPEARGDVFVIGVDGTGERNVTASPARESEQRWAPDGTSIAFLADGAADGETHLSVIPVASGVPAGPPIAGPATSHFAWAPDGKKLLFVDGHADPPAWDGASATYVSQLRTVDSSFREAPSATIAEVDGTVLCHLAWQRLP